MSTAIQINESNFETTVIQSSEPVLVDFWAEWCGPCKMLAPVLDEIAAEHAGRVKVVKVNVDENPALADRFSIRSIPTLLLFSSGKVTDQTVGLANKKAIAAKLEKFRIQN